MLVLARKLGERIVINGGIVIQVVDIDRGIIRLGITAPPEVIVKREELLSTQEQSQLPPRGGLKAKVPA